MGIVTAILGYLHEIFQNNRGDPSLLPYLRISQQSDIVGRSQSNQDPKDF